MDELSCKQQVIDAGHELVEKGLIVRTWGNISCRIDQDRFAVTPSGMGYDRLTPNEIVVVNCRTLEHEGTIKPSGETGIHAAVYRLRPQAGFVIHTHQNAASAISLAGYDALSPTPEERTILGFSGPVPRAKYGLPCSKPLCKAVTGVLEGTDCTVLFMVRHGILSIGADREEAFRRAAVLEDMCRRALREEPTAKPMELELTPFIQAIQGANPSLTDILPCRESPVVRVSLEGKRLIPMLDDFAQLIGTEIACIDPARPEQAGRAIAGRNAVLIKGYGALCAARNREDAQAVEYLLTKECMSRINARQYGMGTPLPLVDRYIMRRIYVNKYSKLK
jgi:ribulose-5-phosphate 4-epimerase/fuculose-1-phosphate aldolase